MAKQIKTLNDLGIDLLEVYTDLRDGRIDKATAEALANVAGKVINSLKVQIEYNSLKGTIDKVQMLESEPADKLLKTASSDLNVQESDTTGDEESGGADNQK